jgi:hypothetical protein
MQYIIYIFQYQVCKTISNYHDLFTYSSKNGEGEENWLNVVPIVRELLAYYINSWIKR